MVLDNARVRRAQVLTLRRACDRRSVRTPVRLLVPGAFVAVPLLATFKIFCDHIVALAAIGEFLGQRDEDERRVTARALT